MTNAFQQLGIAPCLVLADDCLREVFLEASKRLHPDAGGGEGEFATLREALAVLASPSQRLNLWLELRGTSALVRGVIDAELIEVFSEVGQVTQAAEMLMRKRSEAKSSLVLAMLEGETLLRREAVEKVIAVVEKRIGETCEQFPKFEAEAAENQFWVNEEASGVVRNLAFLEKWRAGLRACYARLA